MNEYELAGIETIARGVAIVGGKLLLCRAKGSKTSYLPGGHIEFGETGREALVREMCEETGLAVTTGKFLGVVENSFLQHGKPHAEINLVYEMAISVGTDPIPVGTDPIPEGTDPNSRSCDTSSVPPVFSCEDWITFEWCPLTDLADAELLPEVFQKLGTDPNMIFSV